MPQLRSMLKKTVSQPLKWHGGKKDLARWIISLFPSRCRNPNKPREDDSGWLHYVEPYAGGLSVLLANDPHGISEVVNDKNKDLTGFWRVLQEPTTFEMFRRVLEATPFSEWEYNRAVAYPEDDALPGYVTGAVKFFISCRQSLAGRMREFTSTTKKRARRGMNAEVSAWLSCIEGLPVVHERLKRVLIVGPSDALEVIRKHDGPRTLFYLDPPYLHETRATTGEFQHEMSEGDHSKLLLLLAGIKGRFLLSGYRSDLYTHYANSYGWTRHERKINNHAAGGKTKRLMTECVWTNY